MNTRVHHHKKFFTTYGKTTEAFSMRPRMFVAKVVYGGWDPTDCQSGRGAKTEGGGPGGPSDANMRQVVLALSGAYELRGLEWPSGGANILNATAQGDGLVRDQTRIYPHL